MTLKVTCSPNVQLLDFIVYLYTSEILTVIIGYKYNCRLTVGRKVTLLF